MILSVLQNAAHEACTGTTINIHISTKPLSESEISESGHLTAANIDILDFSKMLVYSISFKHNQSHKLKLADDLTLEKVFSEEPKDTQALKLSLISAQMICKSLLGDLTEQDDGIVRSYEAKFIANSNDICEKIGHDANSEQFRVLQGQQPVQNQVRDPLLIEE